MAFGHPCGPLNSNVELSAKRRQERDPRFLIGDCRMNRDSVLIEADELLTKLGNNNLRIYDATILFFRTETDPATAYQKYLQGHRCV